MKYYKVKVIKSTFPNQYHVICTNNNVTHSAWTTCDEAMTVMRDLNRFERKRAKDAGEVQVRVEPLRLVKV